MSLERESYDRPPIIMQYSIRKNGEVAGAQNVSRESGNHLGGNHS